MKTLKPAILICFSALFLFVFKVTTILSAAVPEVNPSKPVTLKSKITAVTVFSDRAQVTRQAAFRLKKGEHRLLFDNLPEYIEQNSIQVDGTGDAVLMDVTFKKEHFAEIPDKEIKKLYDEKQKLEDALQEVDDKIAHANKEITFVQAIAAKLTQTSEESKSVELDPKKWMDIVAFYRTKHDTLYNEIRDTQKEKREIQKLLDKIKKQIRDIGTKQTKTRNQVEVTVTMKNEGSMTLNLSYIVYGPRWFPVYDLRVSTESKKMSISYNAMIRQSTSEDWENVRVQLSTAKAQISGQQPSLSPWYVSVLKPVLRSAIPTRPAARRKRADVQMFKAAETGEATAVLEEKSPELTIPDAEVETGATSVVFVISGKNTIKCDNQKHKVTIMINDFPAHFRYSTVPKITPFAFLKSKVQNKTEYPFLAGKTNVFLDNHFVANSKMDLVAPSEEFWTFLGVDEGIKVEHKLIKKYEDVSRKKTKLIYDYLITIKNNKKTEEELVVWDQLPISTHEDIKVELIEPKYKEDTPQLKKNELNFLEWFFKPGPGEEIKIPLSFSVEHPKDMNIDGLF